MQISSSINETLFDGRGGSASSQDVVRWVFAAAFALSFVAFIEPAPTDCLLIVGFGCVFVQGAMLFSRDVNLAGWLAAAFLLTHFVSIPVFVDGTAALRYFVITIYLVGSWFVLVGVVGRWGSELTHTILSAIAAGSLACGLLTLLADHYPFPGSGRFFYYGSRHQGLFKDPNVFGPHMVLAAAYALYRLGLHSDRPVLRFSWMFVFLVASVEVLNSYSRGAWLNYATTLAAYFTVQLVSRSIARRRCDTPGARTRMKSATVGRGPTVAVCVGCVVVVGYLIFNPDAADFVVQRISFQHYDVHRFAAQQGGFELFRRNVFGIGAGQANIALAMAPHSLYIRLLVEYGLLGTLCFLGIVILSLRRSLLRAVTLRQTAQAGLYNVVTALLVGILLNSFFIDTLHWRHFWWLLALAWTPRARDNDKKSIRP